MCKIPNHIDFKKNVDFHFLCEMYTFCQTKVSLNKLNSGRCSAGLVEEYQAEVELQHLFY